MDLNEEELNELVSKFDGMTGSDISLLLNEALMEPIREMEKANFWKQTTTSIDGGVKQWIPVVDVVEQSEQKEEGEMQLKSSLYDLPSEQVAPPRKVNMVNHNIN